MAKDSTQTNGVRKKGWHFNEAFNPLKENLDQKRIRIVYVPSESASKLFMTLVEQIRKCDARLCFKEVPAETPFDYCDFFKVADTQKRVEGGTVFISEIQLKTMFYYLAGEILNHSSIFYGVLDEADWCDYTKLVNTEWTGTEFELKIPEKSGDRPRRTLFWLHLVKHGKKEIILRGKVNLQLLTV